MLERKYASPQIRNMSEEEIDVLADILLTRIHAVTGWTIPEGKAGLILADEFKIHLTEKYANMNSDEIMAAFRKYGTTIKDWGKSMNLSLIDQVLSVYLDERFALSQIEEQEVIKKSIPELPPPPMSDQEVIDYAYATWAATEKFEYISHSTYKVLYKNGIVPTDEEREEVIQLAKNAVSNLFATDEFLSRTGNKENYIDAYAKKIFCKKVFEKYKLAGTKLELSCLNLKK